MEFESAKKTQIYNNIFSSNCKVCGIEENCIRINCPNCQKEVYISEGFRVCDFCEHSIEITDITQQLEPEQPYDKESQIEYFGKLKAMALCNECGWIVGKNTVHPMDENFQTWLCVSCNKTFDGVEECSMCAESFAFDEYDGTICSNCR